MSGEFGLAAEVAGWAEAGVRQVDGGACGAVHQAVTVVLTDELPACPTHKNPGPHGDAVDPITNELTVDPVHEDDEYWIPTS